MKCSKCGFRNLSNARFCSGCGVKLPGATTKEVTREVPILPADLTRKIQAGAKQLKGSRRNVAVIFADVSGFTTMSETMDPEEVADRMNSVFQRLSDVIYYYEGYIDKFIGDCVMVLFGAPIAHEYDPLRAVLCGIDMLKAMTEFEELELSIGINYGKVMAGGIGSDQKMDYTVMGDTVNLAQRLESAAGKGEIYVSEKIYMETQSEIKYKKLKSIKVKGKKKPVIPFIPVSVKSRYLTRRIKEVPIVGRDNEMNLLEKLFKKVKKSNGQVVSISGEAGIGKSKLTYEFQLKILRSAKTKIQVLEGRSIDYLKGSDYWSLKQVLRGLIGFLESDSKEEISKAIEKFIKSLKTKSFHQLIPLLKYLFSSEMTEQEKLRVEKLKAEDRYYILNRLIILLFKKIAKGKTLIVVFEDLHWSDNATLKFCESFIKELNNSRIFLLLLSRPEFEFKDFASLPNYHQINLKSLPKDDGLKLAREILKCERIDSQLSGLLINRSDGNPFYIEELASLLLNGDMIQIRQNIAKLKNGELSTIPMRLNELIMAKVDKLNQDLKNILEIASVIGKEFSTKILEDIIELGAELRTDLDLIEKKDLILRLNLEIEQLLKEDEYAFKHIIIKDVVYESILKSERKKQHRFVGETVETLYKNNLDDYLDILIHHFRLGEDKEKLLTYLLKSAEKEKKFGHYMKSEKLYKEYLDITGEDIFKTKAGIEIYLEFVGLQNEMAKYDDGLKILNNIEDNVKTLLKSELFVKFKLRKGEILRSQGKYERVLKLVKTAEKMLTNINKPDEKLKGDCFFSIGSVYIKKGEYDMALKYYKKALDIRLNLLGFEHLDIAFNYNNIAVVYYYKSEYDTALEYINKALNIKLNSLGVEHPVVAKSYNNIGLIYQKMGEFDMALNYHKKAVNIWINSLGDEHPDVSDCYNNIGVGYQYKGEYDKMLEYFKKALGIRLKVLGDKHPEVALCYNNIGFVYKDKGEYDMALKYYQKSLDILLNALGDEHPHVLLSYTNIGSVYQIKGEYDMALNYHKKALNIRLKVLSPNHLHTSLSYHNLAEVHYKLKDFKKAMNYIDKSLKIRIDKLGNDNEETGESEFLLAKILIKLDHLLEAKKHLKTSIRIGKKHKTNWVKDAGKLLKKVTG